MGFNSGFLEARNSMFVCFLSVAVGDSDLFSNKKSQTANEQ